MVDMVAMADMVAMVDIVAMEDIVESDRLMLIPKPTMDMVVTEVDTEAMAVTEDMVDIVANDLLTPMPIMDTGDIEVAMEVTVVMAVDMDMAVKINVPKDIESPKHFSFQITYTK